jgi:triphosphatase
MARLLRLPAITSRRQGRAKTQAVQTIWHDTPAGALAREGLALAEHRGAWRLERLVPNGTADWLPATPCPILATAPSRQSLGRPIPEGLMPVAGFTGRARHFPLMDPSGAAGLTLLEGAVRGLANSSQTCRLTLAGNPAAMAALATELAQDIKLGIPRSGLAAQATAIAQGRPVPARHLGGPAIQAELSVEGAMTLVVAHLADVILHWAPLIGLEHGPEPVHQMRVAARRLRAALSVFRRAAPVAEWSALGEALKLLSAKLGAARDWDVFLSGLAGDVLRAFPGEASLAGLVTAAGRQRQAAYAALTAYLSGPAWQTLSLSLALLPTLRPWAEAASPAQAQRLAAPIGPFAAAALDRRLKHVLARGNDLSALPVEDLHDIRKQAKSLRYAVEFFAPIFNGRATTRFLGRLERVQEALGTVNDRAVAAALTGSLRAAGSGRAFAAGLVQGYVAASAILASEQTAHAWNKFRRADPFWH